MILHAIPHELYAAVASGIGLFIAFIGFRNAGLVVGDPNTLVSLGNIRSPTTALALVGLILDWYKKDTGKDYSGPSDPGVISVTTIYNYYKKFGMKTQIMGASFRNIGEITELAGCDLLTIAPKLLAELEASSADLPKKLDAAKSATMNIEKLSIDKATFDRMHAADRMAHDKLKEGIEGFSKALEDLEKLLAKRLSEIS